ncbi:MAG: HmuY family protein [Bacteroidia bacterium]|nr:HmuY family protein [Bacteroidia bacterium]NND10881.1 hypothetical protein [Flavobacteriaceae bacterium]MBT8311198.1 HmuY family protein [Bacteroidia bacterium]NNK27157.1 hypothetical protein [Flavobacteriaceae bacterium]NNL60494.1 hypothetical protein [Flavobacteriaceae bacterium]
MKTLKLFSLIAILIGMTSCSNDDDPVQLLEVESVTVSNLFAPQIGGVDQMGNPSPISGEFTKFDFSTGQVTTSATEWDIAFRATSIIINGGVSLGSTDEPERTGDVAAYIASGTFASIADVESSQLGQDSGNGYVLSDWYTYTGPPTFLITPTPGKIIVIRTRDGKYAKVEILSYYKDAPEDPDAFMDEERYYTFNYVYQPNDGQTSFE